MMNVRTAIAEPSPYIRFVANVSCAIVDSVDVPFWPWVSTNGRSKIRNASSVRKISATRIAGSAAAA